VSGLTNSNPLMNSGALDDFQPRPKPSSTPAKPDVARTERATVRQSAEERGFLIDNLSTVVRAKRNNNGKASKSHTLRLYIQDINRFQTWCNDNNYSQARGFEMLLDKVLR
jgi:type VI protein secretion system component VasF